MKKFIVPYVRIEHQVYFLEIEAEDEDSAEDVAREQFDGSGEYKVVHAEEFIQDIKEMETTP
jgi:hypothetical protein